MKPVGLNPEYIHPEAGISRDEMKLIFKLRHGRKLRKSETYDIMSDTLAHGGTEEERLEHIAFTKAAYALRNDPKVRANYDEIVKRAGNRE